MIDSVTKSGNKSKFIDLLLEVKRRGADVGGLVSKLQESDFFTAPATAKLIRSYRGGLCEQALARYDALINICEAIGNTDYSKDTLILVALLADLGKINYFERSIRNKKVYSDNGKKYDEMGNFDWVAEETWVVKETSDRFVYGSLGQNAERTISEFIPLSDEEASAIINLHADYENPNLNITAIYQRYPLAVLLNAADRIASFVTSKEVPDVF